MVNKILLIDDDVHMHRLVGKVLKNTEFLLEIALNGVLGLRKTYSIEPQLILLDITISGMDGWDTIRRLRELCDTPIIMFTALGQQEYILKGLDLGADDYITKPVPPFELLARIRAVIRRTARYEPLRPRESVISCGNLKINLNRREVTSEGHRIDLSPTEYRLLTLLAKHKGRVLTTDYLLSEVWGPEYRGNKRYLYMYVNYLRGKVEADPTRPQWICNVRNVGYRFG